MRILYIGAIAICVLLLMYFVCADDCKKTTVKAKTTECVIDTTIICDKLYGHIVILESNCDVSKYPLSRISNGYVYINVYLSDTEILPYFIVIDEDGVLRKSVITFSDKRIQKL